MHQGVLSLRPRWGYASTGLIAATLALFGITWLLAPAFCAGVFGVALEGAARAYGRVKGAEDLLLAFLLGTFLLRRNRGALVTTLRIGLILPLGDLVAVTSAGLFSASALAIHLVFLVMMSASSCVLQTERWSSHD